MQTASFLFFVIKVLYSELSVSEMEIGCISPSLLLAVQHPGILSALPLLSLILQLLKTGAPFPLGDCHSHTPWTSFSRNTFFSVKFPCAVCFYVPFIPLQIIYHLPWCSCPSVVCRLSPCPCHVTLPGSALPVHLFILHVNQKS